MPKKGHKCTEEHKKKLSESKLGNKNSLGYKFTDEQRRHMSESHMGKKSALGYKFTDEQRRHLSKIVENMPRDKYGRFIRFEARISLWKRILLWLKCVFQRGKIYGC